MLEKQLHGEIQIINQMLAAFNIEAGTRSAWTTVAGTSYILYGLRTGPAQSIDAIQKRLGELKPSPPAATPPPRSACAACRWHF